MLFLAFPALAVLPGAWICFWDRQSSPSWRCRWAFAVALSPAVLAVEYHVLRLAGVPFPRAAGALVGINLASLAVIWRFFRGRHASWGLPLRYGPLAILLGVICAVGLPAILDTTFRAWTWHSLYHTDIVYSLIRSELVPEEPELAGLRLGFPWGAHVLWACLAWTMDLGPTVVAPFTSLVSLLATAVLMFEAMRVLGARTASAVLALLLLALGNLPGVVGWSVVAPNDSGVLWALFGDVRTAPLVQKFAALESMNLGLSLLAALVAAAALAVTKTTRFSVVLMPVVVISLGVIYPNLLPPALGLMAAWAWTTRRPRDGAPRFLSALTMTMLATVVSWAIVHVYSLDRVVPVLELSSAKALGKKIVAAGLGLGPFALASWWACRGGHGTSRTACLVYVFGAGVGVSSNLFARLGGLCEYKFLFASFFFLAVPAALGIDRRGLAGLSRRRFVPIALVFALFGCMVAYGLRRTPKGTPALPADHGHFWLALEASVPDAAWTRAVRTQTPEDAVLLVREPRFHASSFTGRALFAPWQGPIPHFGYNLDARNNLALWRGYGPKLLDARVALLEQVFSEHPVAEAATLRRLRKLGRPLVLVYGKEDGRGFLNWLHNEKVGTTVFSEGDRLVYRVDP